MSEMCYVGRCKVCGEIQAAMTDDRPNKELAKELASWVLEGLVIDRAPLQDVRVNFGGCKCEQEGQKKLL